MFDRIRGGGRPLVMGIVNVTPDSFSDGGRFLDPASACTQARRMLAEGADVLDVGGESTRPGAPDVDAAAQCARVLPVIRELAGGDVPAPHVSIDTRSAAVADAALSAGACLVNDVSAGADPGMFECVARHGAGIVLMHMQGTPATMQDDPRYEDVVAEVRDYLLARAAAAEAAGIEHDRIVIDPGIGFGKTRRHNLRLLACLDALTGAGYPVMLGTSRKRFMGAICAETEFSRLVGATCATTAMGVAAGVRLFRVHDVRENRQAAEVAWACREAATG